VLTRTTETTEDAVKTNDSEMDLTMDFEGERWPASDREPGRSATPPPRFARLGDRLTLALALGRDHRAVEQVDALFLSPDRKPSSHSPLIAASRLSPYCFW